MALTRIKSSDVIVTPVGGIVSTNAQSTFAELDSETVLAEKKLTVSVVTLTTQAAVAGSHYVLTNVSATTVTLPASPASGDTVWVTWTNGLTTNVIARNGQTIMGVAEDMTIDNQNATVSLRFINSSWRIV